MVSYIRKTAQWTAGAIALTWLAGAGWAQSGAVPVTIQGRILDLSHVPPRGPVTLSEVFNTGSSSGPQVVFDMDNGNVVLFTTDRKSTLFNTYRAPGLAGVAGSVEYPSNAFYFYSSINDEGSNSGSLAGSAFANSGLLTMRGGPPATSQILFSSSWDNPLWWDRSLDTNPADTEAPLYNWADLVSGDTHACTALDPSAAPQGRFVVLSQRHGCDFMQRAQNVEAAGAIVWIIYDDEDTADLDILATPGVSIPVLMIHAKDGAAIIDYLNKSGGSARVLLHPTNLQAFVSGTYKTAADGTLKSVNLNLLITTQFDTLFSGTVVTQ